jgi:hypothetical protein
MFPTLVLRTHCRRKKEKLEIRRRIDLLFPFVRHEQHFEQCFIAEGMFIEPLRRTIRGCDIHTAFLYDANHIATALFNSTTTRILHGAISQIPL